MVDKKTDWSSINGLDLESLKNPFSEIDSIVRDIRERQDDEIARVFTETIGKLLRENGVVPKLTEYTHEDSDGRRFEMRYGCTIDGLDFTEHDKRFKDEITKLKSSLLQTESQRIELLNRCDELEKQLDYKRELPRSPIETADFLIHDRYTRDASELEKRMFGDCEQIEELRYTGEQLEQIAEHLLIYCKHNKGCEE